MRSSRSDDRFGSTALSDVLGTIRGIFADSRRYLQIQISA